MKHIATIKGFPLIKFQTRERIKELQNGLLYMNSLKKYREMYKDSHDNIIGDPNEGKLIVHEAIFHIPEEEEPQVLKDVALSTVSENDFVFCMFGVNPNKHKTFMYTEEQRTKISEKYDTALLITNVYEFCRRVQSAARDVGLEIKGNFVQYYDPSSDDIRRMVDLLKNGMRSIAFHKVNDYAYQQEYRFSIPYIDGKEHIEIDIKDISDISEIFPADKIFNSFAIADAPKDCSDK
ncbi:MAG: hypothetical protein ACI4TK_18940 [Agathobacter sp.]